MLKKEYRKLNIPSGDLRISITNGCNMACEYCHNEGQITDSTKFMSLDSFKYIVNKSIKYGVFKVRITGGEPLLHPQLEEFLNFLKREYGDIEVGLNTNGLLDEKLLKICKNKLLNRVVIGLDFFDANISKKSSIGKSSTKIKETMIALKKIGVTVEVAVVYVDNKEDIFKFIEWGKKNEIVIKIIEKTVIHYSGTIKRDFYELISEIAKKYKLQCGITADLREYYLVNEKTKVKFFQSHCNRGECDVCNRLHLRITHDGLAKPCIMREDTAFSLLNGKFDFNMRRAIANLGNGPDNPII